MTYSQFILTFILAIITYAINQRINKLLNIKVVINSLYDIYYTDEALQTWALEKIAEKLMDEILDLEKSNDQNFYIDLEIKKLRELQKKFLTLEKSEIENEIKNSNHKRLNKSFVVLSFFDIEIPYGEK